jgi:uncharacterized protein
LSIELHLIPIDREQEERFILYRPLLRLAFIGNRCMARLALRYGNSPPSSEELQEQEPLQFLAQIGFFEPDIPPPKLQPSFFHAVLLLTNRCQLRCTYCYAAAGVPLPRRLSLETGKHAIDYVYKQAIKDNRTEYRIDFHGGGEPTLEWETLQELVRYAREKPIRAKISVTSNGIWSEAQTSWLVDNLDSISLSMDGSPDTQDRQRPLRDQQPSSSIVMRSLQRLDENGFKYGIRMTACSPWTQLAEDFRYILENTHCRSIQAEPAFNAERGKHDYPDPEQANAFGQGFIEAYEIAKQFQASLTYSGARPNTITPTFCSAPFNALVINPDDRIVACYEISDQYHPLADLATYGQIEGDELNIDPLAQRRFHTLLDERFSTCRDCFCHWTCAGDCFARSFAKEPNGHLFKSARCTINREITKYLILDLIQGNGGVWRGNPSDNEIALYG